jgi:Skp family chaperone for outer membrane proteins
VWALQAGAATNAAASTLKDARVGETAAVVAEKGKEYGTKGWTFLKGVYGTVANQVENVARENGYKLDLGTSLDTSCTIACLTEQILKASP